MQKIQTSFYHKKHSQIGNNGTSSRNQSPDLIIALPEFVCFKLSDVAHRPPVSFNWPIKKMWGQPFKHVVLLSIVC